MNSELRFYFITRSLQEEPPPAVSKNLVSENDIQLVSENDIPLVSSP
jgi:hypothetical protein